MIKRIIAIVCTLIMVLPMGVFCAFADTINYVICDDDYQVLEGEALEDYNKYASNLYEETGVQAFFSYVKDTGEQTMAEYAAEQFDKYASSKDGVWMQLTDDYYGYYFFGKLENEATEDDEAQMWDQWCSYDTYYEALAAYIDYVKEIDSRLNLDDLTSAETPLVIAAPASHPDRVVDNVRLLDDKEKASLQEKLDEISERHKLDLVVVTANTLDGKSPEAYADDYFDYNGYGLGEDRSGALLLVSMEDRDWWISTRGYGITAFTDYGIQEIGEEIKPYLSDGDYYDAFVRYAELCDDFVTQSSTGSAYDINNPPEIAKRGPSAKTIVIAVLACLGGGFLFAGIPVGIMKGKLKSVRMNPDAKNYVRDGSFVLTNQRDMFLYRTVTRTAKPKNSSSGGSSTHHSSSGASHGGGGGKF